MASSEFSSPSVTLFVFAACSATAWRDGLAVPRSRSSPESPPGRRPSGAHRDMSARGVGRPVPDGLFVRAVEAATDRGLHRVPRALTATDRRKGDETHHGRFPRVGRPPGAFSGYAHLVRRPRTQRSPLRRRRRPEPHADGPGQATAATSRFRFDGGECPAGPCQGRRKADGSGLQGGRQDRVTALCRRSARSRTIDRSQAVAAEPEQSFRNRVQRRFPCLRYPASRSADSPIHAPGRMEDSCSHLAHDGTTPDGTDDTRRQDDTWPRTVPGRSNPGSGARKGVEFDSSRTLLTCDLLCEVRVDDALNGRLAHTCSQS
jgi:hypothetical protein